MTTPHVSAAAAPASTKVAITLQGREYVVACDPSDEKKLTEIVRLVDAKLGEISTKSPNATEMRLFMLTCLMLADEVIEMRKLARHAREADEALMVAAVRHLKDRVADIAQQVGRV